DRGQRRPTRRRQPAYSGGQCPRGVDRPRHSRRGVRRRWVTRWCTTPLLAGTRVRRTYRRERCDPGSRAPTGRGSYRLRWRTVPDFGGARRTTRWTHGMEPHAYGHPVARLQTRKDERTVTVHFIGAGPGAADLITVRGRELLSASSVCLYPGSLTPGDLLVHCRSDARLIDTANRSLDEIVDELVAAHRSGHDVARLCSG